MRADGLPVSVALRSATFDGSTDLPVTSPDGRWVAYTVIRTPEKPSPTRYLPGGLPTSSATAQTFVTEVATRRTISLCSAGCFRPAWTPDSGAVYYYAADDGGVRLFAASVPDGAPRRVTAAPVKASLWPGDEPVFDAQGKTAFVPLLGPEPPEGSVTMPPDPTSAPPAVFRTDVDPSGDPGAKAFYQREQVVGVGAVDLATGALRTVIAPTADPAPAAFRLSASGTWLAYLTVMRPLSVASQQAVFDLVVVPTLGGTPTVVGHDMPVPDDEYFTRTYAWHPTEDALVFAKDGVLSRVSFDGGVPSVAAFRPDVTGVAATPLTFAPDGQVLYAGTGLSQQPADDGPQVTAITAVPWNGNAPATTLALEPGESFRGLVRTSDRTAWSPRGASFAVSLRTPATVAGSLVAYDVATARRDVLWHGRAGNGPFARGGATPDAIDAVYQDIDTPPDVVRFTSAFAERAPVSNVAPELAATSNATASFVETEVTIFDGSKRKIRTSVLTPGGPKPAAGWPAVFLGYPRSELSALANDFGGGDATAAVPHVLFLANGYAVVLLDLPVGPDGGPANPIAEITDLVTAQIVPAVKAGGLDPKRLALMGHSYGGYMTASVLTRTNLFAAGIAISGGYDLPSFYGFLANDGIAPWVAWAEGGQGRMGGTLWEQRDRFIENSPYFHADTVTSPLLLVHGSLDDGAGGAREMFVALRRLGKKAELATYPGEGHVVEEWSLAHAIDANQRILDFLGRMMP
jgi:dipeptidyl aminopeptidase/acylaminoacyl peptidase